MLRIRKRAIVFSMITVLLCCGCRNCEDMAIQIDNGSDTYEFPNDNSGDVANESEVETEIIEYEYEEEIFSSEDNIDENTDKKEISEAIDKAPTYIERHLGGIYYNAPFEWKIEEDDDETEFYRHIYYEENGETTVNFFELCYVPEEIMTLDADSAILKIIDYTKNQEECDSFNFKELSLNSGLLAIKYEYHLKNNDYAETGYYIPVQGDGLYTAFYAQNRISDERICEIESLIQSIAVSEKNGVLPETRTIERNNSEIIQQNEKNTYDKTSVAEGRDYVADTSKHQYYKMISPDGAEQADGVARQIAVSIIDNPAYTTDLEKVTAATVIVKKYCDQGQYGMDGTKYYRSPYGVFVAGVYTCAGSTRALGRVLDYMGYSWTHTNENQNRHQWCVLTMDGQVGFADGMSGIAGYGVMTNGMTLPDGRVIYFAE